jgi:acyl-coenzyme A synthetase/AMP-(fatty) acid ligase
MRNPDFIPLPELLKQGRPSSFPVALTSRGERCWEDFLRDCAAWRQAFSGMEGSRWALYEKDSWTFATSLFGAWSAGKLVHVPGDNLAPTCAALAGVVDGFAGDFGSGLGKPHLREHGVAGGDLLFHSLPQGAAALVLYTSGSTGRPSAIPKKLSQLASELEHQEAVFGGILGKARILSTVSHQHIYGLLFKILWPLCAGRVIDTRQLFYSEEILGAVEGASSAALVSSPAHLKRLPAEHPWEEALPLWRAVFSSGGPLEWGSAQLAKKRFGKNVFEIYGSSETGGVAWRERSTEDAHWKPLPGVAITIQGGLLSVESPHLPDSQAYLTSDLASPGQDGDFELLGRKDRVVKIEEKRISLSAVEEALVGSGLAAEARALVLPGGRTEIAAVVVLSQAGKDMLQTKGKHPLNLALREAAAARVERVGSPRRWRYVESLPSNAQGKIQLQALETLFEGGTA